MEQIYDQKGNAIKGLFKKDGAIVVSDNDALSKAIMEKDRLQRIKDLEIKVDSIVGELSTIKSLLETIARNTNV